MARRPRGSVYLFIAPVSSVPAFERPTEPLPGRAGRQGGRDFCLAQSALVWFVCGIPMRRAHGTDDTDSSAYRYQRSRKGPRMPRPGSRLIDPTVWMSLSSVALAGPAVSPAAATKLRAWPTKSVKNLAWASGGPSLDANPPPREQ